MNDRQLIADLLSALEYHTEQTRPIEFSKVAIEAAREHLRKPAQRTWVGLSEEDREQHRNDWHSNIHDKEFRAIEAKLRSKNEDRN